MSLELETIKGVEHREVKIDMFLPLEGSDNHSLGHANCRVGWCGNGYPQECICGGFFHAYFVGEDNICYWLKYICDKCKEERDGNRH